MIDFQPLTLEDRQRCEQYLLDGTERGCEFSFANLYLWGRQRAAEVEGHLVLFSQFSRRTVYPYPVGTGDKTAVLVSHNIMTCVDEELPASLSPAVHGLVRKNLDFDGVIMTDDLAMDAVAAYAEDGDVAVMAIEAGNDLIITTDYRTQIPKVLKAVETGALDQSIIDDACRRVLTWKQALGLL